MQAREKCPFRVSIDQRGEQTINRDAKTTGKVSCNLIMFCNTICHFTFTVTKSIHVDSNSSIQ